MLRDEGTQFQVCRNPDLKCVVVERVYRSIRDRLYKYFTYKNSYRYIDACRNLSRPTMTRFTRRLAWRPLESSIWTC